MQPSNYFNSAVFNTGMKMENDIPPHNTEYSIRRDKLTENIEELTQKQISTLYNLLEHSDFYQFDKLFSLYKLLNRTAKRPSKTDDESHEPEEHLLETKKHSKILQHQLHSAFKKIDDQTISINELLSEKEALVSEKGSLINTMSKLEDKLSNLNRENESLKSKIQQDRIDDKIPSYVQGVKVKLQQDDQYFSRLSYNWARGGLLLGSLSVIAAFTTFFLKIDIKNASTLEAFYYFFRGLLGVGLLSWLTFHALNNSKKFTHESIIRKDRQHALMFGEVFLQIYGSTSTKEDAINVFKDWNMSAKSAFSDPIVQPPNISSILSILKSKDSTKDSIKSEE